MSVNVPWGCGVTTVRAVLLFAVVALIAANASAVTTPVILSLDPPNAIAGTGSFTLTVNGANFVAGAQVRVNGSGRSTTFVSSSQLTATMFFGDIANAATLVITVASGGAVSSPVNFVVYPNDPQISSFDPATTPAQTSNLTITLNGSNFASTAVVRVNSANRTTTYVSPTQLTFTLLASDVATARTLTITVLNPNNKISPSASYTIGPPSTVPTITLLSPDHVTAGSGAFTLGVVGTNFVNGSTVKSNSASRSTTFVDSQHLTAQMLASDVATAGTLSIVVNNPNGQVSTAATFTVTSATLPTITSLSPSSTTVGAPSFTLTITGTHFTSTATVTVGSNSTPRSIQFVDAQHVKVTIFPSDTNTAGNVPITLTVPGTTGGTSNSFNLFVTAQNAPVISSLDPSSLAVNSTNLKVLINGTGFLFDDGILLDGSSRGTEFISATQMAMTLLASDVSSAHVSNVQVERHDLTATSAPAMLTIVSANVPAITSVSPAQGMVGSTQPVIAVFGQNFTSNSIVTVDGSPRVTQYISPTELDATLTGSDLGSAHDVLLAVVANAGTSASVTYSIVVAVPAITSINPTSAISGDNGFQLTVTGTNLSAASIVNVNGLPRSTTQNINGALVTNVSATEIASPGTLQVTVTDNGATSAATPLTVFAPQITLVSPASITAGVLSQDVVVTGTSFLSTSKIVFKGNELATTLNGDGTLTATINGSDLISPGSYALNVRNSPTSISNPFIVQVVTAGIPHIDAIDPASFPANSGVTTIRVLGGNFVPLSVVRINGTDRTTQYVNGAELDATLLSSDTATAQTLHVTVRNLDGTTSAEVVVIVT
ncbi:MAG TPA: IPT/TIG domain-containing protein, partial [Thermoanaerobaculia bacterium]|nr:IPT/TIG domain-containing protein [Thermoanaerobaculia bacterium]